MSALPKEWAQRTRDLEHALACARILIAPGLIRAVDDGYKESVAHLLSEIDALLKGTIYERPQAEVER